MTGEVTELEPRREAQEQLQRALDALAGKVLRPMTGAELGEHMAKTKAGKTGSTPLVAFRLEPELVARVDEHRERMGRAMPGVAFTRTDAVRQLLALALEREEKTAGRR